MKITEKTKKQAAELMVKNRLTAVLVNSKGEFFTNKNRAELSEKGKKKNVTELKFSEVEQFLSDKKEIPAERKTVKENQESKENQPVVKTETPKNNKK